MNPAGCLDRTLRLPAPPTPRSWMVSRGLGWRKHGSVEDTKLSTNKQHSLSLCPTPRSWRCWTASAAASSSSCAACFFFCALAAFTLQVPTPSGYLCPLICVVAFTSEVRLRRAVVPAHALLLCRLRWPLLSLHPTWPASCPPPQCALLFLHGSHGSHASLVKESR